MSDNARPEIVGSVDAYGVSLCEHFVYAYRICFLAGVFETQSGLGEVFKALFQSESEECVCELSYAMRISSGRPFGVNAFAVSSLPSFVA